ncbi:MAG: hypothetical protein ABSE89_00695 [Sedimentisphaerales bacterium]
MRQRLDTGRTGFTLIELILLVMLLAILASIIVSRVTANVSEVKKSKCSANWTNLIAALELYATKNGGAYPANQTAFDADILNSRTYFPLGTPVCPYKVAYTYVSTAGLETVIQHNH